MRRRSRRYLQHPTRFGFVQRNALRDWLERKGIVHPLSQSSLLQLSPCATRGAPWLAYRVRAVSKLNKLRSGASLDRQAVPNVPLWNSRIFLSNSQTMTCRYLISRGVLRVRDLIDESTWSMVVSDACRGPKKLRALHWSALLATLATLRAWEGHLPVRGNRAGLELANGLHFTPITHVVACALRVDRRQETAVWRAFHRLCLPPQDLDFIHTGLWKKLPVGQRLHAFFPWVPPTCPFEGAQEDVYHSLKAYSWLTVPVPLVPCLVLRVALPLVGCAPTIRCCPSLEPRVSYSGK